MQRIREYQIRTDDMYGEETVENFHNLKEAKKRYDELTATNYQPDTEELDIKLIEVLEQHRLEPFNASDGD